MDRNELLVRSGEIVNGPRQDQYGPARENFQDIAIGWSVITGEDIDREKVPMMMAWLKLVRLSHASDHQDSWVDLAGYAALGCEIATTLGEDNDY
mgnify:FL=1|tara:strand:- start:442 stop:726 length:285 start_codon:yes stop_codon:yes gene_type:complete